MHLPAVHYILTALGTSLVWFGLYMRKVLGYELTAHKLRMKLSDADLKFATLLLQYNLLKGVKGSTYTAPPPTTNTGKTASERAFATLGLAYGAGAQEIKNKYRILMKKYHPDINKSKDASTKFKAINEAYTILKK